jgi:hypothetical protein
LNDPGACRCPSDDIRLSRPCFHEEGDNPLPEDALIEAVVLAKQLENKRLKKAKKTSSQARRYVPDSINSLIEMERIERTKTGLKRVDLCLCFPR